MGNVQAVGAGSGPVTQGANGGARPQAARTGPSFQAHLPQRAASPVLPGLRAATAASKKELAAATPALTGRGHTRRHGEDDDGATDERPHRRSASSLAADPLDPMTRALAQPGLSADRATMAVAVSLPVDTVQTAARVSLEQVMSKFVRRVAWSGDAHAGTARLELGAGALEGATLTIHSHNGVVQVSLELPPGVDAAEWRDRIARRLDARGLQVSLLEVD